jgi:putative aldouronate transport system substrate-binding protein
MNGVEMGSQELNARVLALGYGETPAEVIVNAYAISTRNARAAAVFQATTSQDGIYGQTLQDKADALLAQSIARTAPADFDRVWDAGIQDWLQSGGQQVYDERARLHTGN